MECYASIMKNMCGFKQKKLITYVCDNPVVTSNYLDSMMPALLRKCDRTQMHGAHALPYTR